MKLFSSSVVLVFIISCAGWQAATARVLPGRPLPERVTKKIEREILRSERQLGSAITKKDVVSLERLLADYFAASYAGGEKATGKVAALELCRAGMLPYYQILAERKLEARAELVQVEGVTRSSLHLGIDRDDKRVFRVKRLWTKKDGRWLLVSQTLAPVEDDDEK